MYIPNPNIKRDIIIQIFPTAVKQWEKHFEFVYFKWYREIWNLYVYFYRGASLELPSAGSSSNSSGSVVGLKGAPSSRYHEVQHSEAQMRCLCLCLFTFNCSVCSNVFYTHSQNTTLFEYPCWGYVDDGKKFATCLRGNFNKRAYELYIFWISISKKFT